MISDLAERAAEEAAAGRFSGAILVTRGTERIFAGAYGLADRERGIPNTLTTRFHNGSLNKMFTGVSVGQLIQAGLVSPTAPVGTYLTDYPNAEVAAKVTIHHLLTHCGGTGDIFVPEFEERRTQVRTVADFLAVLGNQPLEFEPGTRYAYSNYGFILLGAVIEAVSGQSYDDYVEEHVFAPAGMTRTGMLPPDSGVPDLAVGYVIEDGHRRPVTEPLLYRGSPAGCGYTTVEDLWRFATAVTGHRLLDEHHTTLLTTGQGTFGWDARNVCYGFFEESAPSLGLTMFSHTGYAPGQSADLGIWPRTGHVVIVLANQSEPAAVEVARFIVGRLPLVAA